MEALKWWLTAERDKHFLDRDPAVDRLQKSVKAEVSTSLKEKETFQDLDDLKWYADSAEREPLKRITLMRVRSDYDLAFLLRRFSEVEELTLPVRHLTDLALQILSGLTSLRKITFVAPSAGVGAAHMMAGLREIHLLQTGITEQGVEHLKGSLPHDVEVEYRIEA